MQDDIFNTPIEKITDFTFDQRVADVFDDMISRSVPFYREVQQSSAELAAKVSTPNTNVYDLGCSTGTTLVQYAKLIRNTSIRIVGVDNSAAMVDRCREKLERYSFSKRVDVINSNIQDFVTENASFVSMNYTLQFIAREERLELLQRIYTNLTTNGILLLTEKVTTPSETLESHIVNLYYDFKRRNGYSELEIAQKREALEDVLIPISLNENFSLLRDSGFRAVELYLKWFNFATIIAIK